MIKLLVHRTPRNFLNSNKYYLNKYELENNLTWGIPLSLEDKNSEDPDYLFLSVKDLETTVAVSVNISPRILISSGNISEDAIDMIAGFYKENDIKLKSVIGKKGVPELLFRKLDVKKRSGRDLIVHELKETNEIKISNGKMVLAKDIYTDLLADFRYAFDVDTFGYSRLDKSALKKDTGNKIRKSAIFVWKVKDEIVSMTTLMRFTRNIAIIGLVFTPEKHRGKGYGTGIVYELSNEMFRRGFRVCALYTDKLNTVSEKVYHRIGYRPAMEFTDIYFE